MREKRLNRKIIKSCVLLLSVLLLCSCSRTPSIGNGDKPDELPDSFKPSSLEGIDGQLSAYGKYKENAEKAFGSIIPTPAEEFKYSSVSGGVRIDAYIGQGEMIVIPSEIDGVAVTEIAPEAFYTPDDEQTETREASNLRSVYVPDSVKTIGKGAFRECEALQLLRLPFVGDGGENTHIGYIFGAEKYDENAINIPVSLEMIIAGGDVSDYAFCGVKSLDAAVLTDAESIGKFAFYECDELSYIGLPGTLESIGTYAFSSCGSLAKIELPESVTDVGFGAFYLCRSMCDMTLPIIGDGAKNTHIGYMFGAQTADWNEDFVPASLKRITLLDTCTRIENKAFANCRGLVEIKFSETLEFIGIRAFVNCRSIASVTTPASLKTISTDAFFGCDNMVSLKVTGGHTEIHSQAFFGCDALTDIDLSGASKIYQSAFEENIGADAD